MVNWLIDGLVGRLIRTWIRLDSIDGDLPHHCGSHRIHRWGGPPDGVPKEASNIANAHKSTYQIFVDVYILRIFPRIPQHKF